MRTFKEYYWLAPAAAMAGQAMRVSPQTLAQLPSQTYDKVKSGINTVKKIGSTIKNKYKNRVVKGVKAPKVNEKLTKNSSMGDYVKDFYKSDAPQFKNKSKEKRRQMAIAAKLSNEGTGLSPTLMNRYKKASMKSSFVSNQRYGNLARISGLGKKYKDEKLKKLQQTMDKRDRGFNLAVKKTGTPAYQKEEITMTAAHAGIPQDTANMGPRKKKKKSKGFSDNPSIDGRKIKNQSQGISPFRKMYSMM